ncbi:MAG TPA: NUDIX domain-containing protein [Clostridia bacterium]|nr:NUDIX domain-containing protein [Clostridia bacterium]
MEKSCGTILFTEVDGERRYVLVRNPGSGNCAFPKGHTEGEETEIETALRETWEETCVTPEIIPGFRETLSYKTDKGADKTVAYFPAVYRGQVPCKNPDFEELELYILPYEQARAALTHDSAKKLLDKAEAFLEARRGA